MTYQFRLRTGGMILFKECSDNLLDGQAEVYNDSDFSPISRSFLIKLLSKKFPSLIFNLGELVVGEPAMRGLLFHFKKDNKKTPLSEVVSIAFIDRVNYSSINAFDQEIRPLIKYIDRAIKGYEIKEEKQLTY